MALAIAFRIGLDRLDVRNRFSSLHLQQAIGRQVPLKSIFECADHTFRDAASNHGAVWVKLDIAPPGA